MNLSGTQSMDFFPDWPGNTACFSMTSFEALSQLEPRFDETVVITDGWKGGKIAAVLRSGNNAKAALEVLSAAGIRELKIIHCVERIPDLEDLFFSTVLSPAHALFDSVTVIWQHEASVYDVVKKVGADYDMLFFGAPLAFSECSHFYQKIKQVYPGSVTIVRGPYCEIEIDEGDEIYRWVRRSTFDAEHFSIPSVLRKCKKDLGKKVAVLLPSLNEEKTVADVIKAALEVKAAGIIDEVILIDSASTDRTVEIAQSFHIPVFLHSQIRPELGTYHGKGEAMFKSLFVTDADIVAWVDTDIETISPRFFYGLLGPLLTDGQMKFCKGYFSRPVTVNAAGVELGGGRVTELLARPWINTFLPQLSGYIQPLSGTAAIYRNIARTMRIPVTYGVEMAMLIQAVDQVGLWSTCQVNLGNVIHRSKSVQDLGDMAFQIIQVLAEMAPEISPVNDVVRRVYSASGHFEIDSKRFRTVWRNG